MMNWRKFIWGHSVSLNFSLCYYKFFDQPQGCQWSQMISLQTKKSSLLALVLIFVALSIIRTGNVNISSIKQQHYYSKKKSQPIVSQTYLAEKTNMAGKIITQTVHFKHPSQFTDSCAMKGYYYFRCSFFVTCGWSGLINWTNSFLLMFLFVVAMSLCSQISAITWW